MEYRAKKVLEVIVEIDEALEFIASSVNEAARVLEGTMVATPLCLAQHVLTKTLRFLAKEGGA